MINGAHTGRVYTCSILQDEYECNCGGCDCSLPALSPSPPPPSPSPPPPSPPPTTACADTDSGRTDVDGYACSGYQQQHCGLYDDADFVSRSMCCVCGGGSNRQTAQPTTNPTLACEDTDILVTDADEPGDTCTSYRDLTKICGNYDDLDFTSSDLCCACGGGARPDGNVTIGSRVSSTWDDAEEAINDGDIYIDSFDLELVDDGDRMQVVGVGFLGKDLKIRRVRVVVVGRE